jgi:hypothetical protein
MAVSIVVVSGNYDVILLQISGIDVQTASEITKPQLKFPIWEPPVEGNPLFEPAKTMKDLPDYHDEPVYEYVPLLRLTEGEFYRVTKNKLLCCKMC